MSAKDNFFYTKYTMNCGGRLISFDKALIMGIINLTPDSFYEKSRQSSELSALKQAEKMLNDGADILDLGAVSTRPGSVEISEEEELKRLLPALKSIRKSFPECIISVDTWRSEIAKAAVNEGADIINDISGGTMDANMFETIAQFKVPYILMHIQGTPQTMQQNPTYNDVVNEVIDFLAERIQKLRLLGVADIIVDPGFGFGKTPEHNFTLLKHLEQFAILDCPILVGVSRKSMITKTLNIIANEALNGTTVLNTIALMKGAKILRVHDVKEAVEAVKLTNYII
ncbi:MAG: dihydropteroate synthase [Bacteroidia bacterium]|nr:MAG: dihydropteroate synthase [Bacteroidia bacterium]